jgi:hypothetical protein
MSLSNASWTQKGLSMDWPRRSASRCRADAVDRAAHAFGRMFEISVSRQRGPDTLPLAESSEPTEEGIRNELGTEAFPTIRQLIKHPRCTAKPPTRIGNDDAEPC